MRTKLKGLVFAILLISFKPHPLLSQLSVKNNTSKPVSIAIQKLMSGDWWVVGWSTIPAGETQVIVSVTKNRYYYFFAFNDEKTWDGTDTYGWITKGNFLTNAKTNHAGKTDYKKVGFKLVDVGVKGNYTITLDLRTDFMAGLNTYLKQSRLDPIEGLYTVSDEVEIKYSNFFNQDETKKLDHWAKVAIIKDTVTLTRDYVQLVLEGSGLKEGDLMAEYLQTKQSPNLFISEQVIENEAIKNVVVEYVPEEDKLTTTFTHEQKDRVLKYRRTYLKYYPKK